MKIIKLLNIENNKVIGVMSKRVPEESDIKPPQDPPEVEAPREPIEPNDHGLGKQKKHTPMEKILLDQHADKVETYKKDLAEFKKQKEELPEKIKKRDDVIKENKKNYDAAIQSVKDEDARREKILNRGWVEAPNFNGTIGDEITDFDPGNGYARK